MVLVTPEDPREENNIGKLSVLLVQPYHPQFEIDYYFPDLSFEGVPRESVPALPLMEGVRPIELE